MLTESELNRMRKRAEHIIQVGKRQSTQESLIYAVLLGDAMDVLSLLEEVDTLRLHIKKIRNTDFKLITQDEIKVLLVNKNNNEGD